MTATGDTTIYSEKDIEPIPSVKEALNLYLIAVITLGISALAAIMWIGLLSWYGKPIPTELGSLGLVAMTAIAGMVYVKKSA